MPVPDFSAVDRITQAIAVAPVEDLVAVFSQADGDSLLFVYDAAVCPALASDLGDSISLSDLPGAELAPYDGVVVGFSALDVIRPDVLTHGPDFYSLHRVLVDLGLRTTLHRSWHGFARHLASFQTTIPEDEEARRLRATAMSIQLALPLLMDERQTEDLIAVIPDADLHSFIANGSGRWLGVHDNFDFEPPPDADDWIVAFQELACVCKWIDSELPRFIDLRQVLRHAGRAAELARTCQALARRCFANKRLPDEHLAWKLAAEAWLTVEDTEDLVALVPDPDFDHFVATGAGLRVYWTVTDDAIRVGGGSRISLTQWLLASSQPGASKGGFSLLEGRDLSHLLTAQTELADLGPILWQAGKGGTLARTLLALVRCGWQPATIGVHLPPESLARLAQRAIYLIGLDNPWDWRQKRHLQATNSAYDAFETVVRQRAEPSGDLVQDYYQALVEWYRCAYRRDHPAIEQQLRQAADRFRVFLRKAEGSTGMEAYMGNAREIIEIAQTVLYPHGGFTPESEGDDSEARRFIPVNFNAIRTHAANRTSTLPVLSPVFRQAWHQIVQMRRRRQRTQLYERDIEAQQHRLGLLMKQLDRQKRMVALAHEQVVLRLMCEREQEEIQTHLRTLATQARLTILPRNVYLEFQQSVKLTCEVSNVGLVPAREVDLVLTPGKSYALLERTPVVAEFAALSPGETRVFAFNVQVIQSEQAILDFRCNYAGLAAPQEVQIRLPVHHSRAEAVRGIKGNPYKFGRAIQLPEDFFGREEDIKKILTSLARSGHTDFLLRGPRRMGKTSLLNILEQICQYPHLRQRFAIPQDWDAVLDRYVPIRLDLQAIATRDESTRIVHFFMVLLDRVCTALLPGRSAEFLEAYASRLRTIGPSYAVVEQLRAIFQERPETRALVLLDEYDEIYRSQERMLDMALRHVVQAEQRLTWVISSTLALYQQVKQFSSPWFNIFDIVELGCLERRAAQALVQEPSQQVGVDWKSDAIEDLLEATGRHPAYIQLFCSQVIDALNRSSQSYVEPDVIADLTEEIVRGQGPLHNHFEFYWSDAPGIGQLILLALDELNRPVKGPELRRQVLGQLEGSFGKRISTRVVDANQESAPWGDLKYSDGLRWVVQVVNAISFQEDSRLYSFTVPLFTRWLGQQRHHEDLQAAALAKIEGEMVQDGV